MKKRHLIQTKTMVVALAVMAILGVCQMESRAQQQNLHVLVACMKVQPENVELYHEVESEIWKPVHEELVKQGKILGWILYRVHFTGTNDEYNYATATIFADPANIEKPFASIDFDKVFSNKDEAFEKTLKSREVVRRNLMRRTSFAYPENSAGPAPFKYIELNYMKRKTGNYLQAARNIYQPIHQEFVNSGTRAGWSLWNTVYPRGTKANFDFVAVNYFSDFSQIGTAKMVEAFKKAHPDKHQQTELAKVYQTRESVRVELWEVVDQVMAE